MLTALACLLLASSPAPLPLVQSAPKDDCADIRSLELLPPVLSPPRLCVSPGIMTSVLFDHPVAAELQEEARFVEVTRGRGGIGFIPPRDLLPGEQLRLTAVLQAGQTRQSLTFILVAHPGQGSHQINVHYTGRTWQDMSDALSQSLLANTNLSEENAALREELSRMRAQQAQPTGLCGAWTGRQLTRKGIATHVMAVNREAAGTLAVTGAVSFRGDSTVAVEVSIINPSQEHWNLEKAALVNEQGETLKALRFRQADELAPDGTLTVFVEFDPTDFALSHTTLTLADADAQSLTLPNVVFPAARD